MYMGGGPVCVGLGQATLSAVAGHGIDASIQAGIRGTVSARMNTAIGGISDPLGNALAHAAWGCVEGQASGGGCGAGARGAATGALLSPNLPTLQGQDWSALAVNTMIRASIGGLAAVAGGGDFWQGAQSAGLSYLFNSWPHWAELAAYGREAHDLLQDDMAAKGYVVESKCVTPTNCVSGRIDIASDRTLEVWEIKRNSFFGLGMGELALDAYTRDSGLRRGGDLLGLRVGASTSLWKGFVEYQYTNYGDGLIGYSRFDHTPREPIRLLLPKWGPVPSGSRGRHDQVSY